MSFTDLLTNSGAFKTDFYSLWLGDSLAIFDTAGSLKIVNDSQRMGYGLPLANNREFKPGQRAQDAIFNSDQRLVALSSDVRHGFRHSHKAMYEVATVELGQFGNHQSIGPTGNGGEALQLFKWNPAPGARDFVFVYENNIYYQSDYMFGQPLPVTTTGNEHKYHGIADWLYEEEIFSDSTALWWSSSGDYLA
uniref:Dipeptidylpeptidase IV N-terminal domain-containing protein n=1 Tax=Plectus sambesii TaxID=2011161 RepID=A0A914V0L5_9BILA